VQHLLGLKEALNGCFVGAFVCGAITIWLLLAARFPSLRFGFAWEGVNRPMSGIAFVACALSSASWVILLLASGFHYTPVTDHGVWIIGPGFLAFALGFVYDLLPPR
jgi:hypothetical protein